MNGFFPAGMLLCLALNLFMCAQGAFAADPELFRDCKPGFPQHRLGTYEGENPCADCEGIRVQLVLSEGYAYTMRRRYLGKDGNEDVTSSGVFTACNKMFSLVIALSDQDVPRYYSLGFSYTVEFHGSSSGETTYTLRPLDLEGKPVAGPEKYVLTKSD